MIARKPASLTQGAIVFAGILLLVAFALARFAHDVRHLVYPLNDLTPVWVSSKAFVDGKNPYNDLAKLESIWATTHLEPIDGCADYDCILHKYPMAYPPSALPLLSVLSKVPYHVAVISYLMVSVLFFLVAVCLLARKLPPPSTRMEKLLVATLGIALSPIHAGIHHSNLNTVVIAFLLLSAVLMERRPYASGVALAISLCIKPQVAWLFFLYLCLKKRWNTALAATIVCTLLTVTSVLWLSFHQIEIVHTYMNSLARFMPPGGNNSFYMTSPQKYTMVNLQVLAYQFVHSPPLSNLIAWAVFLTMAAISALLVRRLAPEDNTLALALISVLTLLPIYQQIYTAAILYFVVYWAVENWHRMEAKLCLILMSPFLLPLASMTWTSPSLARFVQKHDLGSYFLWNAVVMPHVIWIELLLIPLMLSTVVRRKTSAILQSDQTRPSSAEQIGQAMLTQ